MRRPISSYNIVTYTAVVEARRMHRCFRWLFDGKRYAKTLQEQPLPYRVYKHQSVLIRTLGDVDQQLQINKVQNIRLSIPKINGILLRPGETFSYFYLVGRATRRKGFLEGMMLSGGEAVAGIGGGICQIANLIHWICLHSPLTVTEHHHHAFDAFPDSGRVVPFGSGATLMYNYLDYQVTNQTDHTFQLRFWLDKKCINGELRVDEELPYSYHVYERNHAFYRIGEEHYRTNELWRCKIKKIGSGEVLQNELVQQNFSLVKYQPDEAACIVAEPGATPQEVKAQLQEHLRQELQQNADRT